MLFLLRVNSRKMRPTLEKVLSPAMIRDVSCLGILLLRLPLMNPTLEVLRSVASCIILTRLMKWTYFLQQTPLLHDKECLVVANIVTLLFLHFLLGWRLLLSPFALLCGEQVFVLCELICLHVHSIRVLGS